MGTFKVQRRDQRSCGRAATAESREAPESSFDADDLRVSRLVWLRHRAICARLVRRRRQQPVGRAYGAVNRKRVWMEMTMEWAAAEIGGRYAVRVTHASADGLIAGSRSMPLTRR
jgi:hypothetical protein